MTLHLLRRIHPGTLLIALCLALIGAGPARAALDPAIATILERAAARDRQGDGVAYLRAAAILAIDAAPEAAAEIIATVNTLLPERAGAVLAALKATHPTIAIEPPGGGGPGASAPETSEKTALIKGHGPGPFARLGLAGEIALGGSVSAGNTDETAASAALKLTHKGTRWKHRGSIDFDWTRTRGATAKQRFVADYQVDYTYSDRAFVFAYLQYEDEKFSGFDFRTSQSLGLGYRFLDSDRMRLSAQAGPVLRQDKVLPEGSIETEYGGRASARFEWAINGWSRLENDISLVVGSERTTFETEAALRLKFTERFTARLSYALQWDSNVPPDKVNTDTITRLNLVYGF